MKKKYVYVVMMIKKSHPVDVLGRQIDLKLDWADGMCGVMPVFATKRDALRYVKKDYEIMRAEIINPEQKED